MIGNRTLRMVRIDGYPIEAAPEGYFLVLHNRDVPGVVGAIGTILGQAGINIARPRARPRPRGRNCAQPGGGGRAGLGLDARTAQDDSGDNFGVTDQALNCLALLKSG